MFLRVLEYYEGVLFLTTNRIVTFDLAFKSRIHLALKYNALGVSERKQLWKLFISRVPAVADVVWPEHELDELAAVELNGRQIKNAVRTANSLAVADEAVLKQEDLRLVLKQLEAFEKDLNEGTQDAAGFSPMLPRRTSTYMSRLSLLDGAITEEPQLMK